MPPLAFGLYERLITRALRAKLDALEAQNAWLVGGGQEIYTGWRWRHSAVACSVCLVRG